jgi:para-nitrobenzyl esterase
MTIEREEAALRLIPSALLLRPFIADRDSRRAYLEANEPQRALGTAAMVGRYISDHIFRVLVPRVAEARRSADAGTWAYRFSWVSPAKGWACHCLDVPFWFDGLDRVRVDALAGPHPPQSLADAMHRAAVSLITDGDPGWAPWRSHPGTTCVFDGSDPHVTDTAYDSVLALM